MNRLLLLRVVALLLVAFVSACSAGARPPAAGPGAADPVDAVERFLQLAAMPDYMQMGWVFGTDRGPVIERDPPSDVERRMFALATLLENEGYEVRSQGPVPGRVGNAILVRVALTQRGREAVVPFTAVRGPGQRWFVEQVEVQAVTGH